MQLDIQHDDAAGRFHIPPEALADGEGPGHSDMANMGTVLNYRPVRRDVYDFRSTLVPPHLRGRGIGTKLVLHALDWARREKLRVIPSCPFVAGVIERHPEYGDLVYVGD